jgi:hypothetical protein
MLKNLIPALIILLGLFFVALAIYSPMAIVEILLIMGTIGITRFMYLTVKFKISQNNKT